MSQLGIKALTEKWVRIPIRFFEDHYARALPTPEVQHSTKTYYWIKKSDPAIGELIDDARHYADKTGGPDCGPNLRPSALALLAALGVKP